MNIKQFKNKTIPSLGLGTYKMKGDECYRAIRQALDLGYWHIDTARVYQNEDSIGKAIEDAKVDRDSLFITSKLWVTETKRKKIIQSIEKSLESLRMDYVDLYLIHWPSPKADIKEMIESLTYIKEEGLIRQLGVSNFPPSLFKKAIELGDIFCNQVEYHPYLDQSKLCKIAKENDVCLMAYAPLMQGALEDQDNVLKQIGLKYHKTAFQVTLRWLIEQENVVVIPKAEKLIHQQENLNIFDFQLSLEDKKSIEKFPKNKRKINPEDLAPNWEDDF